VLLDLDAVFHPDEAAAKTERVMRPDDLPPDWRDWYEERLSIMCESGDPLPNHLRLVAMADTLDAMRRAGLDPAMCRRWA
jgi:hypothetical protein